MDRLPVERIGPVRDLRGAVSRTGRKVSNIRQRRSTTAVEQERHGNLLRVFRQQDDGGTGEVIARWPVAGIRNPGGPVPVRIALGPLPGSYRQQYAVSSDGQRFLVNL